MTKHKPEERPAASEAVKIFEDIVRNRKPYQLRWRLQFATNSRMDRWRTTLSSIAGEVSYQLRKVFHMFGCTPKRTNVPTGSRMAKLMAKLKARS